MDKEGATFTFMAETAAVSVYHNNTVAVASSGSGNARRRVKLNFAKSSLKIEASY